VAAESAVAAEPVAPPIAQGFELLGPLRTAKKLGDALGLADATMSTIGFVRGSGYPPWGQLDSLPARAY
jgi:hypothetical protein